MKSLERTSGLDRRREQRELRTAMDERPGDAAAIRDDELTGYGSEARWSHQTQR